MADFFFGAKRIFSWSVCQFGICRRETCMKCYFSALQVNSAASLNILFESKCPSSRHTQKLKTTKFHNKMSFRKKRSDNLLRQSF